MMVLAIQVVYLRVDSISPNNYNPNGMLEDTFEALLEDAKQHGADALDPILVRPLDFLRGEQQYEIIDGENRWKVAKKLGWQRIRAVIKKVTLDEAKAINYRKNRERGTLDPFKEALLFKSEIDLGRTYDEVASKYGVSHAQVGARLSLLNISDEAKNIVTRVTKEGITPSHLELIASVKETPKQRELAEKIVTLDLSVRQAEAEARKLLEVPTETAKEEKLQEPKKCPLELLLENDVLMKLPIKRDETLNCSLCPLSNPCQEAQKTLENFSKFIRDLQI